MHPSKALFPIFAIDSGKTIFFNDSQFEKVLSSIVSIVFGIKTSVIDLQL